MYDIYNLIITQKNLLNYYKLNSCNQNSERKCTYLLSEVQTLNYCDLDKRRERTCWVLLNIILSNEPSIYLFLPPSYIFYLGAHKYIILYIIQIYYYVKWPMCVSNLSFFMIYKYYLINYKIKTLRYLLFISTTHTKR